jgi:hypothetical protein
MKEVVGFPAISNISFLSYMKFIGFEYRKLNSRSVCVKAPRIAGMRHAFLRDIKRLRNLGYKINYTEGSWAGANHILKFGWL